MTAQIVACGGGSEDPGSGPGPVTPSTNPISSRDDVQKAAVRIVIEGAMMMPDGTSLIEASGSGFIIDPSGLAVTNNHVVSGASIVRVYLDGEAEPRPAKILGVSECSDLAVIDIDGDGFPFLGWFEEEIKVGIDVFAAGFPLGDPEYTLTEGIVAKTTSSRATDSSGVEKAIEHTANLQHGNSGGPLIDDNGKVIGVNYYGMTDSSSTQTQFFAISRDEAKPIIEVLKTGEDKLAMGVNGTAVTLTDGTTAIWVFGVKTGSPADKIRIRPGDIITKLEGIPMGADGSMIGYCQILRSHGPTDPLKVEVYRDSTRETLEGEINGRELAVISASTPIANEDQVLSGTLTSSDLTDDEGNYYDLHSFEANAGDRVNIWLESEDFDAYLYVFGTKNEFLVGNDDNGTGVTDSYVGLSITETGTHSIFAGSYNPGATGAYTLTIDFVD